MKNLTIIATGLFLCSCASQQLPSNVSLSGTGMKTYLEAIDFSYESTRQENFSSLTLCLAENIASEDVVLNDTAGSFVGAYTGNYYQSNNSQIVSGRGIFTYVDEENTTVIVNGTTGYVSSGLIPIRKYVKFSLRSGINQNSVKLTFSNITRAQQNTGSLANNGFNPVGTWSGADSIGVYDQLEIVANRLQSCLSQ